MREDGSATEVVRHRFRNGDPAQPLRRTALSALRDVAGADPADDWVDDVLIVISELVQNVSQHTGSDGELVVTLGETTVLVEVGDRDTTSPRLRRPDAGRAGGRGLLLIEAMARQWGVRTCPEGKTVWARMPAISAGRLSYTVVSSSFSRTTGTARVL